MFSVCLPHASHYLLRKVLRVEFVNTLDDCFHELAGRGVIGVLGNGDYANALSSEKSTSRRSLIGLNR